jgi:cell fate (sporulation/competence/biofilm development) regulator YlbF (YheA/YmcA/DUF963 family)
LPLLAGLNQAAVLKEELMTIKTTGLLSAELRAATEQLAQAILQSEPFQRYQSAQAEMNSEPEAQVLLGQLSVTQAQLRQRQANGTLTQNDLEGLREVQRQAQANPTIMEVVAAQQAALAYLPEVNFEIIQALGVDFATLAGSAGGCC